MLPFISSGYQVGVAMTALYGLLGLVSMLVQRLAPAGTLRAQVNAWWRIFPVVSLALLLYPYGLALLAVLICTLAAIELAPFAGRLRRQFLVFAMVLAGAVAVMQQALPGMVPVALGSLLAVQGLIVGVQRGGTAVVYLLFSLTVMATWIITRFESLPFGSAGNLAWLFYLFIVTALNDIGQFVAGKLFGRAKIAPTISPNKTWQGLAGGLAVSQIVTLVMGAYLALATPGRMAGYAVLLSLGGFVGDLMFSAAKRHLGIKDFSQLIPGHGGILDRVDSLVVTAPLLYCLLLFRE